MQEAAERIAPQSQSHHVSLRQRQRLGSTHGNLVVSRKVGEPIVIYLPDGQKVVIAISGYHGSRTSLRVMAPRATRVMRGEAMERDDANEVAEIMECAELAKPISVPVPVAVASGVGSNSRAEPAPS